MRRNLLLAVGLALMADHHAAGQEPIVLASELTRPFHAAYGPGGALYVVDAAPVGAEGKKWLIRAVENGKVRTVQDNLSSPAKVYFHKAANALVLLEATRITLVDAQGKATPLLSRDQFAAPQPNQFTDLVIDEGAQTYYFADAGQIGRQRGAIYKYDLRKKRIELFITEEHIDGFEAPYGLTFDGNHHLLFPDYQTGKLHRVSRLDRSAAVVAEGLQRPFSLGFGPHGQLFIRESSGASAIPRPGAKPVKLAGPEGNPQYYLSGVDFGTNRLIICDQKRKAVLSLPATIPGWEVDESPLPVEVVPAFPKLKWTGWDDGRESGKLNPLRPVLLTHAGDGSNRNFVLIQQGIIHAFPNDDNATETKVFLDISKRIRYLDRQNEEGLLGLAFHPKYKANGEFFVYYTDVKAKMTNVLSRFRVSKDDPNRADPDSEEILMKFEKPYWNHDGGTICFGPDGYLYVTHGDGGAANDPHENGQNLKSLLGKVHRIDVDRKENGKNYAIPADNPFVNNKDALPEIWAYGLRNLWRMAFDRETGKLWAGDVGQNLYEEIDIIEKGGNYGWNIREGLHPFGKKGVGPRKDLIDPIWEYHHDLGKSITGGHVYRGKQVPKLQGLYLYGDYVSTRLWALRYDFAKGRVTANHPIKSPNVAVMSYGEDEQGESYILAADPKGKGIWRFVRKK